MSFPKAQPGPSQVSTADIPVVVNPATALQLGTHPIITAESTNVSVNHYGSVATLPSPIPVGGKQIWDIMQTENYDSHGRGGGDAPSSSQNNSVSYGTPIPSVFPSQSQPGFPSSDSWTVPAPSQSNTQARAPANNLHRGMNNSQNSLQPQAPANHNSSWSQGAVNPNMGWLVFRME
ncbi:hypothetical protein Bca52824_016363 [Brassica carinata]|uniref:Uncharacterized protein n=1 Tax=Brassica carinata TaxID=52824 RepID=A0A8X7W679_BRACI|nr:hypothetical protein Bca52824_016363 [Brassica carinata]